MTNTLRKMSSPPTNELDLSAFKRAVEQRDILTWSGFFSDEVDIEAYDDVAPRA